ncbi:MAG: toll/interleukin-1 receptor domain-containing protein [Bryobacteraceae bacterium]
MAYVPGCSADVFISYAHSDNQDAWVTKLKDKLTAKLNPFLAGRAEVWFDDRIQPGVYFREEIQQKLTNTPLLVAVLSPSYLDSEFCIIHELEWFENQGGKEIIQLIKVPLSAGQEVPIPQARYEKLYDEPDGRALTGQRLERALDKIVAALTMKLRAAWELRPKVYVAQLRDQALTELKGRLHAEGYAILPKGLLPARVPDGRIRNWMEEARVSILLSGTRDDTLAQRQVEIGRQVGKPTIILGDRPHSDQIAAVIGEVQTTLEAHHKPAIYFVYDHHSDGQRVCSLCELVAAQAGCEVVLPEGGEKYHKFRLRVSDGILLFRRDAPDDWLNSQEQSLLQAAALRGDRFVPEAWYFTRRTNGGAPGVRSTQGPRRQLIIERVGEPDVTDLQPFLDALRSRLEAAGGQIS